VLLHQMKNNLAAAAGSDAVSCSCLWESCWTTPEVYSESGDELVVNTANSTSTAAELGTASSPRIITIFQQTDDMILSSAAGWLSGLQDDLLTTAFISHGMVLDMRSNSSPLHDVADHDSSCDNMGSLDQVVELYIRMTGMRHPAAESSPYYSVLSPAVAESCGEAAALSSSRTAALQCAPRTQYWWLKPRLPCNCSSTQQSRQLAHLFTTTSVRPCSCSIVAGDWNGNIQYPVPTWIMSSLNVPQLHLRINLLPALNCT
jgi:hypothetical protein